jgi:tetratricopeptide (TPR) repeat protein
MTRTTIFLTLACIFCLQSFMFAQDADPEARSRSSRKVVGPKVTKSRPKTTTKTIVVLPSRQVTATNVLKSKRPVSRRPQPKESTLDVSVNEGQTLIEIFSPQSGTEINISSSVTDGPDQTISFNPLDAGEYIVKISKSGYSTETKRVSLTRGKSSQVSLTLHAANGWLTVNSDADDAQIEINGIGTYAGKIENLPLSPRIYQISAVRDGYEPVSAVADIHVGQTTLVSLAFKPVSAEKLLSAAVSDFSSGRYEEAISNCRLSLEQNRDSGPANLLMGLSYFRSDRTRESRFYLARAMSLDQTVELPVKIYQKEKNSEILVGGTLKVSSSELNFSADQKADLSFRLKPGDLSRLELKPEKLRTKPDAIELKGNFSKGNRSERQTVLLYPQQAFARALNAGRAEIAACLGCSTATCGCQTEIQAIYELLSNWKLGSYQQSVVVSRPPGPPSTVLTSYEDEQFSLKVPANWQTFKVADANVWFSPNGGFFWSRKCPAIRVCCQRPGPPVY